MDRQTERQDRWTKRWTGRLRDTTDGLRDRQTD